MNKMIEMLKGLINSGKSPQEIAMQMLGNNGNPIFNNLVMMAQKGDYKGVENVAHLGENLHSRIKIFLF